MKYYLSLLLFVFVFSNTQAASGPSSNNFYCGESNVVYSNYVTEGIPVSENKDVTACVLCVLYADAMAGWAAGEVGILAGPQVAAGAAVVVGVIVSAGAAMSKAVQPRNSSVISNIDNSFDRVGLLHNDAIMAIYRAGITSSDFDGMYAIAASYANRDYPTVNFSDVALKESIRSKTNQIKPLSDTGIETMVNTLVSSPASRNALLSYFNKVATYNSLETFNSSSIALEKTTLSLFTGTQEEKNNLLRAFAISRYSANLWDPFTR